MAAPTLERLRREGESFMEAISREYYLAASGHKPVAELQPIYARYSKVLGGDALDLAREMFRAAPDASEDRRSARTLLEWQVESHASKALAALDEREIAWEASAFARTADGREISYQRLPIEIAAATDRQERLALDDARAALVARELSPLKRERLQREKDLIESLDIAPGYIATFEALSGVNLHELARACEGFLRDTEGMWEEVLPRELRRTLGIGVDEATRADALALLRAPRFDAYFPGREMETSVRRQASDMGIDPDASGRVILDVGEREGKRSRAFCAPVRVPDEVYLVLRPHGGATDYRTLLHELGHALHFAYMRGDLPFEYRWLGDNSITEGYAMLFDHLMQDAGWLLRYTELGRPRVPEYLRAAAFEELQFLRRYCGKLLYELQLYGGTVSWQSLPDLYVETLRAATSFRYQSADAFVDVDPRFYSARYLQAWQLQALLRDMLVERFDVDWYRNPGAGPWMVGTLFGEGQRELAAEQAERVAAKPLSFAPVMRAIEERLAG